MSGLLAAGKGIELVSRGRLVVFGDGLKSDFLRLEWGQRLVIRRSDSCLRLVAGQG